MQVSLPGFVVPPVVCIEEVTVAIRLNGERQPKLRQRMYRGAEIIGDRRPFSE
jgi:hypothetical protein